MHKRPEHKESFSEEQLRVKHAIKTLRILQEYDMNTFAKALGITRKKLEDLETTRTTYGCYVTWDVACAISDVLGVTLDRLRDGG